MKAVRRRLGSLRNLELFNVVFLPLAFSAAWRAAGAGTLIGRYLALGLVCWLLLQGGVYWHLKLRSLNTSRPLAYAVLRRYWVLERVNLTLLSLATFGPPLAALVGWVSVDDALWALALTAFAWLEFTNYFRVQLAHDTLKVLAYLRRWKRLRPSALAADLRQLSTRQPS